MAHDGGGYARPRRRRRRRVPFRLVDPIHGTRRQARRHPRYAAQRKQVRLPKRSVRAAPSGGRPKVVSKQTYGRHYFSQHPLDKHTAAHAVQTLGYKATAQKYGKHTANAGRARIQQVRARRARNAALKTFTPGLLGQTTGAPGFQYAEERRRAKATRATTKLYGRSATPDLKKPKAAPSYKIPNQKIRKAYRVDFRKQEEHHIETAAKERQKSTKALEKIKPKKHDSFWKKFQPHFLSSAGRVFGRDLPKAGRDLGKAIGPKAGKATPYALHAAGINLGPGADKVVKKEASRAAEDLLTMAGQAPASTYYTGKAVAQSVVKGKPTKELKDIGRQLKHHDPIALAAQGKFKQAAKSVERHPGYAAAEVIPGARAVDIGAGAIARSIPGDIRRAASRERAPKIAQSTAMAEPQQYSRGLVHRAVQVRHDKLKAQRSKDLYKQAAHEGRKARDRTLPAEVRRAARNRKVELRQKARETHPQYMKATQIKKRVSRRVGLAETRRRAHQIAARVEVRRALKEHTRHPGPALLVAQGITAPTREGLTAELTRLAKQHPHLTETEKHANELNRANIEKALGDKHLDGAALEADLRAGAHAYHEVVQPRHEELMKTGVLPKEKGRMSPLVPYAVKHMGAEFDHERGRLVVPGKPIELPGGERMGPGEPRTLPAREIEKHMRNNPDVLNPEQISYLSQRPIRRGAFFKPMQKVPQLPYGKRTGAATERGSFEATPASAEATVAEQQGLIDWSHEYRDLVQEHAERKVDGSPRVYANANQAHQALRRKAERGNEEWVAVPIRPKFGTKQQAKEMLREHDQTDATKTAIEHGVGSARYVLIRKAAQQRMIEHLNQLGEGAGPRALRIAARQFKSTVLTTTLTWPVGNIAEATVRTALKKAGPASYLHGRRVLKELERIDPRMAEELRIRLGHGHFGSPELDTIHTTLDDFKGSKGEKTVQQLHALRNTKGPKQAADLWNLYTDWVFANNARAEKQFHVALLGRYAKSEMGLMGKAAEDAAKGLRGSNAQFKAGEWVARAYGRYDAFEPGTGWAKVHYAPFVAWTMNAIKFLTSVLPRDHPLATSLLAISTQASEKWRKEHGYDIMPPWMKGMVPSGNGLRAVGRYTPFGLAADPVGTAAGLFPLAGVIMNLNGFDWKGDPLEGYRTGQSVPPGVSAKAALGSLFTMFVPFAAAAQRVKDKGLVSGVSPFRKFPNDPKLNRAFHNLDLADTALKNSNGKNLKPLLKARSRARWEVHQQSGGKFFKGMKGPGDFQVYISPKGTAAAKERGKEQAKKRKRVHPKGDVPPGFTPPSNFSGGSSSGKPAGF